MEDDQSPAEQLVSDDAVHGERGLARTDEQKAEAFPDNLERQCSSKYANVDVHHIDSVHMRARISLSNQDDHEPEAMEVGEELRELLKATKVRKASAIGHWKLSLVRPRSFKRDNQQHDATVSLFTVMEVRGRYSSSEAGPGAAELWLVFCLW